MRNIKATGGHSPTLTLKSVILRNPCKPPQSSVLLLVPLMVVVLLFLPTGWNLISNRSEITGWNEILSHLFQHNPHLPTNYTGGHKGWQQLMPKYIAERLNYKTNGFFIECGALDGVRFSNTLLLEQTYNWTGLLVEADPRYASVLIRRNRKAWVADVGLSPQLFPMQLDMVGHKDWPGMSHAPNDIVGKGYPYRDNPDYSRKFRVQCFPLAMLLEALNRTEIDYLSLDVEGMELDILRTIPFDKIHIQLISLEVRPANQQKLQDFLVPLGYKKVKNIQAASDFMHDDVYECSRNNLLT